MTRFLACLFAIMVLVSGSIFEDGSKRNLELGNLSPKLLSSLKNANIRMVANPGVVHMRQFHPSRTVFSWAANMP